MLKKSFYHLRASELAPKLLGQILVHKSGNKICSGKIVEVEAYEGSADLASHSARGETPRSRLMFGKNATAYIYLSYGMHFCFNVVCDKPGVPGAVLIRALEPLLGIQTMQKRRGKYSIKDLCSGPGKLCQALGLDLKNNGQSLLTEELHISQGESVRKNQILSSSRVGISQSLDLKWRFGIKGSSFLSRKF